MSENNSKIAFTSDMWTSDTVIAHTGLQIQKVTYKILQDFSIATKALAITIDNATLSNELQVDFNVIRCGTHSITFVVNVGLGKV
ncbi:7152_t:CDS:2 [Rhizophagus irregularis]|nr:7152_t:CDS:2 [Rhizophagus irregularis]